MIRLLIALLLACHLPAAVAIRDDAGVIKEADGTAIATYAARIPTLGPKDPPPGLIVALHGINGNEKQLIDACKLSLQAAERESGYVVLGLKSQGAGWEVVDHERIRKAVAWAIATHRVDPRRVFGWGYSHGAIRLGHFAAEAQDLFAGAVLWAGTCQRIPEDGSGVAYYAVHGESDPTVKPDNIRAARDTMRKRGVRLVYREYTGGDHGAPFSKGRGAWADHILWLDALRNARIPLEAKASEVLAKAGAELDQDGKLGTATTKALLPVLADNAGPDGNLLAVFGQSDRSENPVDGQCPSVLWIAGVEESSPRILGVSAFANFKPLSCVLAPSSAAPGSVAVYYSTSDYYPLGVEYSAFLVSPTSAACLAASALRTTGTLLSVAADGDAHTIWRDGLTRSTQPTESARIDAWVSSRKPIAGRIAFTNHVFLGTPSFVWTPAGASPTGTEPDPPATTSGPEHLQWVFHRDFLADKRCLERIRTQDPELAIVNDAELARRISSTFDYQQGRRPACLMDGERLLYVPRYAQHSWGFWLADDDSFLSYKQAGRIFTDAAGELAVAPSDHAGIMVWLRRPDGSLLGGRCPSVAYIGLDSCALAGPWLCFGNDPAPGGSLEVHAYPVAALGELDAQGLGPIIAPALRLSLLGPDDWVAWTPEGYHAGTPAGIRRLAWVGPPAPGGNLPEVLAAEQIAARFLRPDLLIAMWERGEAVGQVLARLGEDPGRVSLGDAIRSAPQVAMRLDPDAKETEAGEAGVRIDAVPGSEPIAEIALFHNEARIQLGDSRGLRRSASTMTTTVALLPGDNVLRAIALTADGVASAPVQVTIRRLAPKPKADCLILAIGIDAYLNPAMALRWAAADAQALARRIERDASALYRSLDVRIVPPESTTRDGLRTAIAAAAAATRPEDTLIIIYAGHGTCTAGTAGLPGQFLLVPSDMSNLAGDDALLSRQGIASDEVRDLLIAAPARRKLLIMDACNAGKAAESFARRGGGSERALQQLHRSSGIAIVAATTSEQLATEAAALGHGLFTAAALEALAQAGGQDRTVSLGSFVAFVTRRVPELAQELKQPLQFPTYFLSGQDFPLVIVP